MKAWRWHCTTHSLDRLTVQTGSNPPMTCHPFADIVWPDTGPCFFQGTPVLDMFPGRGVSPDRPIVKTLGQESLPDRRLPVRSPDSHLRSGTPPVKRTVGNSDRTGGAAGEAGRVTTPPLPATRPTT